MYKVYDPFEIVRIFERQMAAYSGARFAAAVDTCSAALELCCEYLQVDEIHIPSRTYISVPQSIIRAGGKVVFENTRWRGAYTLHPYPIIDSALQLNREMHIPGTFRCLSFHHRKHLDIGRGGMILHDDPQAVEYFIQKRFHGRHECSLLEDIPELIGHPYNMEPSRAATGLHKMLYLKDQNPDLEVEYPDISKYSIFR